MAHVTVSLAQDVHHSNHGIFTYVQFENMSRKNGFPSRTTRFPISLIRHLSLIRLFSSSCPEEHSRVSIDFSLLRQDNGRWQVHMCVCVRICAFTFIALAGFALEKTLKNQRQNREMRVVWVWCTKYKKNKKHWEKCQSTDSVFGTIWSTMDPKKGPKTDIFPDAIVHVLTICRRFPTWVLLQTPKKDTFSPQVPLQVSQSTKHPVFAVMHAPSPDINMSLPRAHMTRSCCQRKPLAIDDSRGENNDR